MNDVRVLPLQSLDEEAFGRYGRILEPRAGETPEVAVEGVFQFYVLLKVASGGWQIGFLDSTCESLEEVERHPGTPEVFVPLAGHSALVIKGEDERLEAFSLTRPVVLDPGVWHGVIRLSGDVRILIAENDDVKDEFHDLPSVVRCDQR